MEIFSTLKNQKGIKEYSKKEALVLKVVNFLLDYNRQNRQKQSKNFRQLKFVILKTILFPVNVYWLFLTESKASTFIQQNKIPNSLEVMGMGKNTFFLGIVQKPNAKIQFCHWTRSLKNVGIFFQKENKRIRYLTTTNRNKSTLFFVLLC